MNLVPIDRPTTDDPIHSFKNPPVIETVLGFQFTPIPTLKNVHLALFWERMREKFPLVEECSPIPLVYETFEQEQTWNAQSSMKIVLGEEPPGTRLKLTNLKKSRMLQIQNGRFHLNWMRTPEENYPRFQNVMPEFQSLSATFREFLSKDGHAPLSPEQWEVTYVNHLSKGELWATPSDW